LSEQIRKLFENKEYEKSITEGTTDPETISKRFKLAKEYLVQNEK
jgi:hypothetical protein